MKKIFLSFLIVACAALPMNAYPAMAAVVKAKSAAVKTPTKAKPAVKAKTKVKAKAPISKYKTTMKWDASGLKYLNTPSHFDYSSAIRNAVIKKIENYARRNKIKVITIKVIDSMRE